MSELPVLDLAVSRIPGLRCAERHMLAQRLSGADAFAGLSRADLEALIGRPVSAWEPAAYLEQGRRDGEAALRRGISVISFRSAEYPPLLRELHDPPELLFCRGRLPDPERPLAAVVGTREAGGAAAAVAYGFGRDFALSGVPVVSGLARGIDAMAHRGNVDGGAPTVAVLGCGLDGVYPASNRGLARRILEAGGALLSEYPPGTEPFKWHFPARNRIIAGLARALVVVEAPETSGALISAQFGLDLGRDVWVASHSLASPRGGGCRALAEQGARAARSAAEVLEDWASTGIPAEIELR